MNRSLVALLSVVLASSAGAQDDDAFVIGARHVVPSAVLGEDREVWVHTPASHETGRDRYPVLVLLDGPRHFHHTTGIVEFLAASRRIPEMIVVGVSNTDRTRDLTPHASDVGRAAPEGGGAADFLTFLCDELVPWVDAHHRTRPTRLLVGHSFGGLFAVNALTVRPGFFAGLIAISPSLQWAGQRTVEDVARWLETDPEVAASVYLTVGSAW